MCNNLELEDSDSVKQHMKALEKEMSKSTPRDSVLLPLLKSTFGERRMFIINEASSVLEIKEKYPALTRPISVSYLYSRPLHIVQYTNIMQTIAVAHFRNWTLI